MSEADIEATVQGIVEEQQTLAALEKEMTKVRPSLPSLLAAWDSPSGSLAAF
jgi:hypothetical protein